MQFEVLEALPAEFTAELLFVLAVVVSVLRSLHLYLVKAIDFSLIAAYKWQMLHSSWDSVFLHCATSAERLYTRVFNYKYFIEGSALFQTSSSTECFGKNGYDLIFILICRQLDPYFLVSTTPFSTRLAVKNPIPLPTPSFVAPPNCSK